MEAAAATHTLHNSWQRLALARTRQQLCSIDTSCKAGKAEAEEWMPGDFTSACCSLFQRQERCGSGLTYHGLALL